ncbi:MAG: hypothetical protein CME64_02955 [Halobacteriovoraceae bacterium]|nr:hypothetical protein [Halobacteriovoraceae bacterium]|tara:strand:- start:14011 stop:14598 length:588 start_codon:yes stop_codon:yes gene_type:complete
MESLGKRLYKSTALKEFKVLYMGIAGILLTNLVLQTYSNPLFTEKFQKTFSGVVDFHIKYPEDFLVYCFTILFPAIYYSFIRGIVFYEKGMTINRGFPFFNRSFLYSNISKYKIIHPKYLMGVKRSDIDEEFVFTIRNIDRVVAILDQQNIPGNLGKEKLEKAMTVNKKLVVFFVLFGTVLFVVQHFGGFAKLLR